MKGEGKQRERERMDKNYIHFNTLCVHVGYRTVVPTAMWRVGAHCLIKIQVNFAMKLLDGHFCCFLKFFLPWRDTWCVCVCVCGVYVCMCVCVLVCNITIHKLW